MNNSYYAVVIVIAALVIWRRTRGMVRPIKGSGVRLLIPLLFLLPGVSFLFSGSVHAPAWEWVSALTLGALLSVPLIWTTHYEIREDRHIYVRKNYGFIVSFLAVIALRIVLKDIVPLPDPQTAAALFLTLAAGYLVPWRVASYVKFRKVYGNLGASSTPL